MLLQCNFQTNCCVISRINSTYTQSIWSLTTIYSVFFRDFDSLALQSGGAEIELHKIFCFFFHFWYVRFTLRMRHVLKLYRLSFDLKVLLIVNRTLALATKNIVRVLFFSLWIKATATTTAAQMVFKYACISMRVCACAVPNPIFQHEWLCNCSNRPIKTLHWVEWFVNVIIQFNSHDYFLFFFFFFFFLNIGQRWNWFALNSIHRTENCLVPRSQMSCTAGLTA